MNGIAVPVCWAVYREVEHSPERELDDALILRMSAALLESEGLPVRLMLAEELPADGDGLPSFLFHMCERPANLARLGSLEARGVVQVNRPAAVLNAHRDRSMALFEREDVPVPPTRVVRTDAGLPARFEPCWIKRTDHKTRAGDVRFASSRSEAEEALGAMREAGIARAVLQGHVDGDLVKFYGVGGDGSDERWFEWFYNGDGRAAGHPFRVEELRALAFRAASAVGVEVFGGDVIVDAAGRLFLIDLNAWPSFALYRDAASARIGAHLAARVRSVARC